MLSQQSSSAKGADRKKSSQRWTEVSINELNTRFWRWLNTLPASCRWNRWGSNMEPVYLNIAALQFVSLLVPEFLTLTTKSMLYHTALISLNRPFLASSQGDTGGLSPALAKIVSDATSICEASADTVLSILNRFKAQHGLRVAPLSFVHGAVMAVEATLGVVKLDVDSLPVTDDSALPALKAALEDMSCTWEIAGHARKGLQSLFANRQLGECRSVSISSPSRATESTPSATEEFEHEDYSANYTHMEFPNVGFDADLLDLLPVGAFDTVDSYYWPVDGMVMEGDESSQGIVVSSHETCLPNM
jgi:hypothetical protein